MTRDTAFQEPTRPFILSKPKKPGTEESLTWKMSQEDRGERYICEGVFFFFKAVARVHEYSNFRGTGQVDYSP
jgi:hypothetical protein